MTRLIVTCLDAKGQSCVLPVPASARMEAPGLLTATLLWQTQAAPVVPLRSGAAPEGDGFQTPISAGARFALIEFLPGETKSAAELDTIKGAAELKHAFEGGGRHASMHTTDTLEYCVVLDGDLTLILDTGDVVLRAGDMLVQGGVRHGWANRGAHPAKMLGVQIGAERK